MLEVEDVRVANRGKYSSLHGPVYILYIEERLVAGSGDSDADGIVAAACSELQSSNDAGGTG